MKTKNTLKSLLSIICLVLSLNLQAQEVPPITVNVASAGTLPSLIASSKKDLITNLTVTGNLNGDDIRYIREMAGSDISGKSTTGKLSVLDLSGANIVDGGSAYYYNGNNYCTSLNQIGSNAFVGCTRLTAITIPNSVTSIANRAFYNCTSLTSINIGNSVKSIESDAFSGCTGLTSVTIPNNVTSIESDAFNGCTGLTSVTIGNSVKSIGDYAFYNCKGLASITIPNSVTSIGSCAFMNCPSLKEFIVSENNTTFCSVEGVLFNKKVTELIAYPNDKSNIYTLPNGVTSIRDNAFSSCTGLTSITIPNGVTSIGSYTFRYCTGLTSITIPNGVTSIGSCTFEDCTGLTLITISNSVASIEQQAFNGCTGLTLVTIPNNVTSIGNYAFNRCTGLTSVTIGNSVKSIGDYAFYNCKGLTSIHCNLLTPINVTSNAFSGINKSTCKLYVPKGAYGNYWAATVWSDFTNIIEEDFNGQVVHNITLTCNNNGIITVNGSNVTSTTVNNGNSVTIKFSPNDGCTLSKVTLNGNDITNAISDYSYTISNITNDITINATFTEMPIYLTFKQADNGSVKRLISKGSTSTYVIEPAEGWKVNSVIFNGVDVTSQLDAKNQFTTPAIAANSTLNISFENTNTAISQTKSSNIKVYTDLDAIVVTGTELGDNISVYTESGALLRTVKASDSTIRITAPANHTYLIKTTGQTFKVAL